MTLSATYTVNGNAVTGAVAVAYGSTVNLAITSLTGVQSVAWEIVGNSHSSLVNPTITKSGSPNGATASFTMVADPGNGLGASFLVKATVSDGGTPSRSVSFTAVIGATNPHGIVPLAYGEETERSTTHGWAMDVNKVVATGPYSWATATTTNATTTTVLTVPIDADKTVRIRALWHGRIAAGTTQAIREAVFVYRRIGAGPVQMATDHDVIATTKDDATWGALDHAASSNNVIIRVTGKAATNIDWTCGAWITVL